MFNDEVGIFLQNNEDPVLEERWVGQNLKANVGASWKVVFACRLCVHTIKQEYTIRAAWAYCKTWAPVLSDLHHLRPNNWTMIH